MQNAIDVASILEKPESLTKVWSAAYEDFKLFHGPDAGDVEKVQKQLDFKRDSQFLTNLWYFDLEPEETAEPSRHQYDGYEAAMSGESPQSWHSSKSVAQSDYTPQSPRYVPQSPQYVPESPGSPEIGGGDGGGAVRDHTAQSTCGSVHSGKSTRGSDPTEKIAAESDDTGKSACGSPMDIEVESSTAEVSGSPGLHPGRRIQLAEDEEFTELTPQEMDQVLVKLWAVKEAQDEQEEREGASGRGTDPDGVDETSDTSEREAQASPYSRFSRDPQASHASGLTPEMEAAVEAEVKALHLIGRSQQKKRLQARKEITARMLQEAQAAAQEAATSQSVKTASKTATHPRGSHAAQTTTKRVLSNLPTDLFGPPKQSDTERLVPPQDSGSEPAASEYASKRLRVESKEITLSAETQEYQRPTKASPLIVKTNAGPMTEADTQGREKGQASEPKPEGEEEISTFKSTTTAASTGKDTAILPSVDDIDPASVTIDTLSQAWFRAGYLTGLYKSKNGS